MARGCETLECGVLAGDLSLRRLRRVPKGRWSLLVELDGYQPYAAEVFVDDGAKHRVEPIPE